MSWDTFSSQGASALSEGGTMARHNRPTCVHGRPVDRCHRWAVPRDRRCPTPEERAAEAEPEGA